MRDFIKFISNDNKLFKISLWTLYCMLFVIIINTFMQSTGLDCYKVNLNNIIINTNKAKLLNNLSSYLMCYLSSLALIMMSVSYKNYKKSFIHSFYLLPLLILIGNFIKDPFYSIILVIILLLYNLLIEASLRTVCNTIFAIFINTVVQYIVYCLKGIGMYNNLTDVSLLALSIDYFIIMLFIIIIKYFIQKRGDNNGRERKEK